VAPGIFVVACALIVINAFYADTGRTLIGAAIILAGIPVYYLFRRRA
jgi:hypothetical protein